MILFIVPVALWLWNQASDAASGLVDFLRSIPSLIAPKPIGLSAPYTPPFTGGQCADGNYTVTFRAKAKFPASPQDNTFYDSSVSFTGKFGGLEWRTADNNLCVWRIVNGIAGNSGLCVNSFNGARVGDGFENIVVTRTNGTDNCGNLQNPVSAPSINDDGLFKPTNPLIADENEAINPAAIVLLPAIPLVLVPLVSTAIAAALAAAKAASDALEAVKKIAEALEGLVELWKLLKEFLDDWKKNRSKNRDIVRQTYGQILGDGALDFFPSNNTKFKAIQLDVIITTIPIGFGKFFGSLSPSRYRYKELGYIAFYSVHQGILEVHSIQFKRTSYQIPELAVGFIYHLGLNDQIKGYAFGTFSVETS